MKRRNFLRNIVLGIAASLVPKILQPMDIEGVKELNEQPPEWAYKHKGSFSFTNNRVYYFQHRPQWLINRNHAYGKNKNQ